MSKEFSETENKFTELIYLSHLYGADNEFVIAGGGNTSYKDKDSIWIKASGVALASIQREGFLQLSRKSVREMAYKEYPGDTIKREKLIKNDLLLSVISSEKVYYRRCIPAVSTQRPSVETSLHEIFEHPYVVHTHPTYVNAMLCSQNAQSKTYELFGNDVLFIKYTDPGYTLFMETMLRLEEYRLKEKKEPSIIFLENHGMIAGGSNPDKIREIHQMVLDKIKAKISKVLADVTNVEMKQTDHHNAVKKLTKKSKLKIVSASSDLIDYFVAGRSVFEKVSKPFTPDDIVYCKARYLFIGSDAVSVDYKIDSFVDANGYFPRIIAFEKQGVIACADTEKEAGIALEIFINMMKVSMLSESFGGPKPLSEKEIYFIDNWESENYRRNLIK